MKKFLNGCLVIAFILTFLPGSAMALSKRINSVDSDALAGTCEMICRCILEAERDKKNILHGLASWRADCLIAEEILGQIEKEKEVLLRVGIYDKKFKSVTEELNKSKELLSKKKSEFKELEDNLRLLHIELKAHLARARGILRLPDGCIDSEKCLYISERMRDISTHTMKYVEKLIEAEFGVNILTLRREKIRRNKNFFSSIESYEFEIKEIEKPLRKYEQRASQERKEVTRYRKSYERLRKEFRNCVIGKKEKN